MEVSLVFEIVTRFNLNYLFVLLNFFCFSKLVVYSLQIFFNFDVVNIVDSTNLGTKVFKKNQMINIHNLTIFSKRIREIGLDIPFSRYLYKRIYISIFFKQNNDVVILKYGPLGRLI